VKVYQTDTEFKQAIEREMKVLFSRRAWVLVSNFLSSQGIHPSCTEEDIKEGVAKIRSLKGVIE